MSTITTAPALPAPRRPRAAHSIRRAKHRRDVPDEVVMHVDSLFVRLGLDATTTPRHRASVVVLPAATLAGGAA